MMRWVPILLPLALLVLPLGLRPEVEPAPQGARTLIIITPHGEPTREEFGQAFVDWARRERGVTVTIDWRTPGGSGDIERVLDARYAATPGTSGIDLLWGGGEFTHRRRAAKGHLADAGLLRSDSALFTSIPATASGETIYDAEGRYYGACLSAFGLCWNVDRIAALDPPTPPATWADLAAPRFADAVSVTDPTRSAAALTALERLVQEYQERAARAAGRDGDSATPADLAAGWDAALAVLRRITANARAITDGASKAVHDVARGDAAAAMSIDFNARAEAQWAAEASGRERLVYAHARGGTSVSADPIALLVGAPHPELAIDFMRFVLSSEGQRLWNQRPGTPGGPRRWALRRLPVRGDAYTPEARALMSDPLEDPYALAAAFRFRPAWTAAVRPALGDWMRSACLDLHAELRTALRAIDAASDPGAAAAATALLDAPVLDYAAATAFGKLPAAERPAARLAWTRAALASYRAAAARATQQGIER